MYIPKNGFYCSGLGNNGIGRLKGGYTIFFNNDFTLKNRKTSNSYKVFYSIKLLRFSLKYPPSNFLYM